MDNKAVWVYRVSHKSVDNNKNVGSMLNYLHIDTFLVLQKAFSSGDLFNAALSRSDY
jgi:hypothetical protein